MSRNGWPTENELWYFCGLFISFCLSCLVLLVFCLFVLIFISVGLMQFNYIFLEKKQRSVGRDMESIWEELQEKGKTAKYYIKKILIIQLGI